MAVSATERSASPPADASLLVRTLPTVHAGEAEWFFTISPFDPDPSWRTDLNSFAVFAFRDGAPIEPNGSEDHPFHFAVNSSMGGRIQVESVAASVLSTLRRQERVAGVIGGSSAIGELPAAVEAGDQTARGESAGLAALLLAGQTEAAANLLGQYGHTIHFRWLPAWLTDQPQFAARLPFLGRAYNELSEIRDVVDRIVSATVGSGGRFSSTSERVRREAERMNIQGTIWRYMAHSIRDAEVSGLGVVSMSVSGATPRVRLIHPGLTRVGAGLNHIEEWKGEDKAWHRVSDAFVLPGATQRFGSLPLSILEPLIPSLNGYFSMTKVVAEIDALMASGDEQASRLAEPRAVANSMAEKSRSTVGELLEPARLVFPEARHSLYFRGKEPWGA